MGGAKGRKNSWRHFNEGLTVPSWWVYIVSESNGSYKGILSGKSSMMGFAQNTSSSVILGSIFPLHVFNPIRMLPYSPDSYPSLCQSSASYLSNPPPTLSRAVFPKYNQSCYSLALSPEMETMPNFPHSFCHQSPSSYLNLWPTWLLLLLQHVMLFHVSSIIVFIPNASDTLPPLSCSWIFAYFLKSRLLLPFI